MLCNRIPWMVFLVYIATSYRQFYSLFLSSKYTPRNRYLRVNIDDMINIDINTNPLPTPSDIAPVEFTTNPMSYKYKKTGCDDRYPLFEQDPNGTEILYNLSIHIRKMALLTLLQNNDISIYDKVLRIETEKETSILPNIEAGGLFDDWEREV